METNWLGLAKSICVDPYRDVKDMPTCPVCGTAWIINGICTECGARVENPEPQAKEE